MTDRIAPDYSKHVKTPMYLNLIKSKLKSGAYDSLQSFDQDARLMFDNCVLYNGDGSYFGVVSAFYSADLVGIRSSTLSFSFSLLIVCDGTKERLGRKVQ